MSEKLMTVREVAETIRRSKQTIRRWVREGFIKRVVRVRDGILIPAGEVQRIIDEGSSEDWKSHVEDA